MLRTRICTRTIGGTAQLPRPENTVIASLVAKARLYRSRGLCAFLFLHSPIQQREWADWLRAGVPYTSLRMPIRLSYSSHIATLVQPFSYFSPTISTISDPISLLALGEPGHEQAQARNLGYLAKCTNLHHAQASTLSQTRTHACTTSSPRLQQLR